MLSDQQITRFQKLYKTRFNKEISREEAYAKGVKLVRLMQIVYQPITKEEYKQLQERRKITQKLP